MVRHPRMGARRGSPSAGPCGNHRPRAERPLCGRVRRGGVRRGPGARGRGCDGSGALAPTKGCGAYGSSHVARMGQAPSCRGDGLPSENGRAARISASGQSCGKPSPCGGARHAGECAEVAYVVDQGRVAVGVTDLAHSPLQEVAARMGQATSRAWVKPHHVGAMVCHPRMGARRGSPPPANPAANHRPAAARVMRASAPRWRASRSRGAWPWV